MVNFGFVSLALLSLQTLLVRGQDAAEGVAGDTQEPAGPPTLAVTVSTAFPASEVFGVKLVNGNPTEALLSFMNSESEAVTVNLIGGSLWTPEYPDMASQNIRNLTATRYNTEVAADSEKIIPYSFSTDMHPQDIRLNLAAVVSDVNGNIFTMPAYNQTVSVVEPDTSIFDPQVIFLYVFLLTCFVGVVYFFYTVWIAPYFPQKRRGGKPGEKRQKTSAQSGEQNAATTTTTGTDAGITSAKTYDAEWIPSHHIQPPQPRKVKGGKLKK